MGISGVNSLRRPIFVLRLAVDNDVWAEKSETSIERFDTSRFRSGANVCTNSWMEGTAAYRGMCTELDEDGDENSCSDEGCSEMTCVYCGVVLLPGMGWVG
jgi:hypothetical protein